MTLREILEGGIIKPVKPLTPKQAEKRADRRQQVQQRIADERTRSAAKIRDLKTEMP
ncbi:hypothetical protein SAMN05216360_12932 [Methylobacterium phyllostachyos]|uniref:Uncharacterized protein n=1 Tax=Methylobacterium phyllostachyos TaxID=582672 RepID=A0A1H0KVZ5_9HYPH|nr:hypothetical protein [Methylobacterium phyllostachyos]SDO59956.1 hypothetical protein SAMN05216360_12932 [Methylobacterium phyllostachyos]